GQLHAGMAADVAAAAEDEDAHGLARLLLRRLSDSRAPGARGRFCRNPALGHVAQARSIVPPAATGPDPPAGSTCTGSDSRRRRPCTRTLSPSSPDSGAGQHDAVILVVAHREFVVIGADGVRVDKALPVPFDSSAPPWTIVQGSP
ncbi:MAG TPA: hypothetical protein PLD19_07955, partial [Luteimonas sp.]|nr:hypothetical protein [Luteimonas sp.]